LKPADSRGGCRTLVGARVPGKQTHRIEPDELVDRNTKVRRV
jgi:hypothetical protein